MSIGPAKDEKGKWKGSVLDKPLMAYCPVCKRYFPVAKIQKHIAKHHPDLDPYQFAFKLKGE
jgi:hypothetical protein